MFAMARDQKVARDPAASLRQRAAPEKSAVSCKNVREAVAAETEIREPPADASYLTAVETDPNVVLRLVPAPLTTAMMLTAIPDASKPYSMAVAPDSSLRKAVSFRRIMSAPFNDAFVVGNPDAERLRLSSAES